MRLDSAKEKISLIKSDKKRRLLEEKREQVGLVLALVILWRENDVELKLEHGLAVALDGFKVDHKIRLDGENTVCLEPRVVLWVELGGAALVLGVGHHDMDMGGAHWGAVHKLEQVPAGAIGGK